MKRLLLLGCLACVAVLAETPEDVAFVEKLGARDDKHVIMYGNFHTDAHFAHLMAARNMEELSIMGGCALTALAFKSLGRHPKLREIDLAEDALACRVPLIQALPAMQLKALTLFGTPLTGPEAEAIRAAGIEELNISGQPDEVIGIIGRMKSLRRLVIDLQIFRSPEQLAQWRNLQRLEELRLFGSNVGDKHMRQLGSLPYLRILGLSKTSIDGDFFNEGPFPKLKELNALSTDLDDEQLGYIAQLPDIEVLLLGDTDVGNKGVCHLARATALRSLSLNNTSVGDSGLACHPSLRELHLENTGITDDSYNVMLTMPNLRGIATRGSRTTRRGSDAYYEARAKLYPKQGKK